MPILFVSRIHFLLLRVLETYLRRRRDNNGFPNTGSANLRISRSTGGMVLGGRKTGERNTRGAGGRHRSSGRCGIVVVCSGWTMSPTAPFLCDVGCPWGRKRGGLVVAVMEVDGRRNFPPSSRANLWGQMLPERASPILIDGLKGHREVNSLMGRERARLNDCR